MNGAWIGILAGVLVVIFRRPFARHIHDFQNNSPLGMGLADGNRPITEAIVVVVGIAMIVISIAGMVTS